jgi:hypothetical protein
MLASRVCIGQGASARDNSSAWPGVAFVHALFMPPSTLSFPACSPAAQRRGTRNARTPFPRRPPRGLDTLWSPRGTSQAERWRRGPAEAAAPMVVLLDALSGRHRVREPSLAFAYSRPRCRKDCGCLVAQAAFRPGERELSKLAPRHLAAVRGGRQARCLSARVRLGSWPR